MPKKSKRSHINKIIEDNLDYLVRFAYYRLNNRAEAEELVYEAVLRLLERDIMKINPESVRMYLFRIVHNMCMDKSRCADRRTLSLDNIEIADNEETVLDMEEADRLNTLLDKLPARESDVIRMNIIDGLSFVEISNLLSIPASTAKSRFRAGVEKLRQSVSKRFKS
ncbi:MAG: sigma-70 family RNA polymerase sigma factor [Muribaculaceae bacterium]|nr:sigma-70 family RNA polymerase sigma factor [Muribaculaceae bacterium]